jgi:hypothetical protein
LSFPKAASRTLRHRFGLCVFACGLVAVAASVSGASAATLAPGATRAAHDLDKIHSCITRVGLGTGRVRIIYAPARYPDGTSYGNPAAACNAIEVEVDWAQTGGGGGGTGPTGPRGPTGPPG